MYTCIYIVCRSPWWPLLLAAAHVQTWPGRPYVYMCIYIYIFIYLYIFIYSFIHLYIHISLYSVSFTLMTLTPCSSSLANLTRPSLCIYVYIYIYIYIFIYLYIFIYSFIHLYIHISLYSVSFTLMTLTACSSSLANLTRTSLASRSPFWYLIIRLERIVFSGSASIITPERKGRVLLHLFAGNWGFLFSICSRVSIITPEGTGDG